MLSVCVTSTPGDLSVLCCRKTCTLLANMALCGVTDACGASVGQHSKGRAYRDGSGMVVRDRCAIGMQCTSRTLSRRPSTLAIALLLGTHDPGVAHVCRDHVVCLFIRGQQHAQGSGTVQRPRRWRSSRPRPTTLGQNGARGICSVILSIGAR